MGVLSHSATPEMEGDQETGQGIPPDLEKVPEREEEFLEKCFPPAEGAMDLDPAMLRIRNLPILRKPGRGDTKEKSY